jgi:hypothetical protein
MTGETVRTNAISVVQKVKQGWLITNLAWRRTILSRRRPAVPAFEIIGPATVAEWHDTVHKHGPVFPCGAGVSVGMEFVMALPPEVRM